MNKKLKISYLKIMANGCKSINNARNAVREENPLKQGLKLK